MKLINLSQDAFHIYKLVDGQLITFMKKVGGELVHEGTTNEEIIEVLIHRIGNLNTKFPCIENSIALDSLREALSALEERTNKRVQQGVEGQDIPHV